MVMMMEMLVTTGKNNNVTRSQMVTIRLPEIKVVVAALGDSKRFLDLEQETSIQRKNKNKTSLIYFSVLKQARKFSIMLFHL